MRIAGNPVQSGDATRRRAGDAVAGAAIGTSEFLSGADRATAGRHPRGANHARLTEWGPCQGKDGMQIPKQAALMRIYTKERARAGHQSLFEAIVRRARDAGIAGATVLRGPMGFGQSTVIHNASIVNLSADLPLVIEIVDAEEKLREFLHAMETMEDVGLVTLEKVEILHHGREGS